MASVMEIMQLCRLCLVKDEVNIPIFEEKGDLREIFLKISACLPVKVAREDNLPKNICDGCSYKLELLYEFWNTSANSEKQLLKWLSQVGVKKASTSDKVASVKMQPHSINSDNVVLKQEVVDLGDSHGSDDELDADDLNVSNDAQDYILQQQQLPYQPVTFEFQQEGFTEGEATSSTAGPSATITSEAAEAAPKRKRRAAAMKALPPHIDSEEEDEDDVDMVETKIAKTEEQSDDSASEDPEPTTFVGLPSTSTDNEQPGPSGVGKGAAEAPFWDPLNLLIKPELPDHQIDMENDLLICNICQQNYANSEDLRDHIFSDVLDMFICCKCGSKFVDEKTFRLHLREHKRQTSRLVTNPSGKLIDVRVNNMFICKYCDAPFRDRVDFYNHYMSHTRNASRRKTKTRNIDLNRLNIVSITPPMISPPPHVDFNVEKLYYGIQYTCNICQEGFFSKNKNIAHLRRCVGNIRRCDLCRKTFSDNLMLFEHYELIHKEFRRMCKFCFHSFSDEKQLIHHIMKIHLKFVQYCYDCNEGFESMYKYNCHLKTHLTHFCHECKEEFTSLYKFNCHMKTHTMA